MNIYGIYKNGTDDHICKTERDTDMENNLMEPRGERG